jgi:ribosome recycling factor
MSIQSDAENGMQERIDGLKAELGKIRTGRANARVLDVVKVDYYGSLAPIKQVANVAVVEGRTLEIRPFDPSVLEAIEKGIAKADIGVAPQNDGKVLRLTFPAMTTETRQEAAKDVGRIGEEFRVAVRGFRQDAMKAIKRAGSEDNMPEDEQKGLENKVQKITDKYVEEVDSIVSDKQAEIETI